MTQRRSQPCEEIEQMRLELTAQLRRLRLEIKAEFEHMRTSLLQWMFVFWLTEFAALLVVLWRVWSLAERTSGCA